MHPMTIRLPDDLYEHYRNQAFQSRVAINTLIIEAMISYSGYERA